MSKSRDWISIHILDGKMLLHHMIWLSTVTAKTNAIVQLMIVVVDNDTTRWMMWCPCCKESKSWTVVIERLGGGLALLMGIMTIVKRKMMIKMWFFMHPTRFVECWWAFLRFYYGSLMTLVVCKNKSICNSLCYCVWCYHCFFNCLIFLLQWLLLSIWLACQSEKQHPWGTYLSLL